MRKGAATVAVAEGINVRDAGFQCLIDFDVTARVNLDARFPQPQVVRIRHATDSQ
jgi:hypothetical protein